MSHTCLCLPSYNWYSFTDPGGLSRPWCEVAQAEIRTRNLPVANPTLYHTATSAPKLPWELSNSPTKDRRAENARSLDGNSFENVSTFNGSIFLFLAGSGEL